MTEVAIRLEGGDVGVVRGSFFRGLWTALCFTICQYDLILQTVTQLTKNFLESRYPNFVAFLVKDQLWIISGVSSAHLYIPLPTSLRSISLLYFYNEIQIYNASTVSWVYSALEYWRYCWDLVKLIFYSLAL